MKTSKREGGWKNESFLDKVRAEAALPEYDLFVDYSEMATQFGYVAVWSTIWPLASGELLFIPTVVFWRIDSPTP